MNDPSPDSWQEHVDRWEGFYRAFHSLRDAKLGFLVTALAEHFLFQARNLERGLGPGTWVRLLLKRFPAARVFEVDHEPAQPRAGDAGSEKSPSGCAGYPLIMPSQSRYGTLTSRSHP